MDQFGQSHYVPVILTRQGERLAMRELTDAVKSALTPLFALHPIDLDLDLDSREPKNSMDYHLRALSKQLRRDWGMRAAFVDSVHLDTKETMADGSHPLVWMIQDCAENGLILDPVLSSVRPIEDRRAAIEAADSVGTGLVFRLASSEWVDLGTPTGDGRLLSLLGETKREPGEVHMILDFADQLSAPLDIFSSVTRTALHGLPLAEEWKSVTVVASGMPIGTSEVGADNSAELPRLEWQLWRSITDSNIRRPTFGDYGVQHPDPFSDFDPRIMQSAAQLRYTLPLSWLVARGRGVRSRGMEQIRALAAEVIGHPGYCGPEFSWGDQWLMDCASSECSPGNQMVWRKVGTNHHLTYVVDQLATLRAT